jgi:Kef-type K+ transport system membrane component KefB
MLPVFFVVTGLTVNLAKLPMSAAGILAVILAAAILGKVGGGYAGARLTGIPPRNSAVMAALVNTRGLTELVILSVGLQAHLVGPQLYALLVVMALVTTAMTGPLLNWLKPPAFSEPDSEAPTGTPAAGPGGSGPEIASVRPGNARADRMPSRAEDG